MKLSKAPFVGSSIRVWHYLRPGIVGAFLLWGCTTTVSGATGAASELSLKVFARLGDADSIIAVRNGGVLRSGDSLQLRVSTKQDAYVYVIAYGSSNSAILLHPFSGKHEESFVRAGVEELIPRAGVFLPLDDREGRETLFAIASEKPLEGLAELLAGIESHEDDLVAITNLVRQTNTGYRRVTFRHVGARTLVGVDLAHVRRSEVSGGAPPPSVFAAAAPASAAAGGDSTGFGGSFVPPAGVGLTVPESSQAGDSPPWNNDEDPGGAAAVGAAAAKAVPKDSAALRRAKQAAGIDSTQFQGILATLPGGSDAEVPQDLRERYREVGVLSAEGSRIRALKLGQPSVSEKDVN